MRGVDSCLAYLALGAIAATGLWVVFECAGQAVKQAQQVEAPKVKTTRILSPFGPYTATDVRYGSGCVTFKSNGESMTLYGNMLLIESDAQ